MSVSNEFVKSQIIDIEAKLRDIDQAREILFNMKKTAESALGMSSNGHNGSGHSTGFRDAVRQALKNRPQGLTPREIIQNMSSSGELSRYTGQVKPSVRIHNELYVLGKKGEVVKQDKRYRLKELRS